MVLFWLSLHHVAVAVLLIFFLQNLKIYTFINK